MKKIIFLVMLATVLVAPAWAAVEISCGVVQVLVNGQWIDTDTVLIGYDVNSEPNHIRAFALDVQLVKPNGDPNADANFVDVNDQANEDYWVFPGSIDINEAGAVNDVGTAIADICDLPSDTLPGLDSNGVTIEMGSLYVGAANAPDANGTLIELVVDDDCNVIVTENFSRGGVVSEGAASKSDPCLPPQAKVRIAPREKAEWRKVGKPKCWCPFKGGRQCHGDADNRGQGKQSNIWASTWDSEVFRAAQGKTEAQLGCPDNLATIVTSGGDTIELRCADFKHDGQGKAGDIRVSTNDSAIFRVYQGSTTTEPNCPLAP
jgi:hypothetical protein